MAQILHRPSGFAGLERASAAVVCAVALLVVPAAPARADIAPTFQASDLSSAISADPGLATGASFVNVPPGYYGGSGYPHISPVAVSGTPLASFATDGPSYGMLTTGDPRVAGNANDSEYSGKSAGGGHFQGVNDFDVTVLRVDVDVPSSDNCLSFDYRFLSEEFPEYVGGGYNDTFIAQLDRSDWYAGQDSVSAPGDFASDGTTVGVDSAGAYSVSADNAAGTTYDAATRLITAQTTVSGGVHSLYFSIFDQGDPVYDSAVFLDNLRSTHESSGECASPESPPQPTPTESSQSAPQGEGTVTGRPVSPQAPVGESAPHSTIDVLPVRVRSAKLRRFSGKSRGDDGVARVEIALVGFKNEGRASRRGKAPRCVQMNSRRQILMRRPAASACSQLVWVGASGTKSWTYSLKRALPKGSYVLYSRAISKGGSAENNFSAANGNRISFNVY